MKVRLATPDDDTAIARLLEDTPMPGGIRLAPACRPSFFAALRVEGGSPVVVVAEDGDGTAGLGVVTRRAVYLNGAPAVARYLSCLRVAPRARGSSAMARGFDLLRRELSGHPADLTFTSILDDNIEAARLLTSGRATLPAYERWQECVTRVFVTRGRGQAADRVAPDADELAAFFAAHGPGRNGFPVCRAGDLDGADDSPFPGLRAADFLTIREPSGELAGVLGCWDTRPYRQTVVAGYAPALRLARPCFNLVAGMLGMPRLPAAGSALPLGFVVLPLTASSDPDVVRALLAAARVRAGSLGLDYLVWAMPADDPLTEAFAGLPCREIRSTIFRVRFGSNASEPPPDGRPAHFEAAML
jgi:hypothetical protein